MSLEHFLQLASAGRHDTASSGEKACQRIARAIVSLQVDLERIDMDALRGVMEIQQYLSDKTLFIHEGRSALELLQNATRPLPVIPLEDRDNDE